jgi:outer membrane protein
MSALKFPKLKTLKLTTPLLGAVLLAFTGTAMAQTPPATPAPGTQKPAAPAPGTQKPAPPITPAPATPAAPGAQTPPAPAPAPPKPFPEGAKIAYVNVQAIASNSVEGKAATAKIQELQKKKTSELGEKNKALQAAQTKLQQGGSVLNDAARGALEKEIEKMNRDIQFFQQDANTEIQELQNQLQADFQEKLNPILEQVATEKGLHMLLDVSNSGAVWANSGLDLTAEVIRRFDAAKPAAAPKK